MINSWWLAGQSFASLILIVWVRSMAYRHGIWDGAFNHFLPIVRREMFYYDKHRAKIIFDAEDGK
jgi:hypothetical protein